MNPIINQTVKFPLIYPENDHFSEFSGILQIHNVDYSIKINVPHYPNCDSIKIQTDPEIENLESFLNRFNLSVMSLEEFLYNLSSYLMEVNNKPNDYDLNSMLSIVEKCVKFSNDELHVSSIKTSEDFQKIQIFINDPVYEQENFLCLRKQNGTNLLGYDSSSFPTGNLVSFKHDDTLEGYMDTLSLVAKQFQKIYATINQLNSLCWVLNSNEEKFNLNYLRRRVVLVLDENQFCSIEIDLSPLQLRNRPNIMFFGNEDSVAHFQEIFETNLTAWDDDDGIVSNLLRIFELPYFPTQNHSDLSQEDSNSIINDFQCCICFSYRNNFEKLPDVICKNVKCHKFFHEMCLSKWFLQTSNYRKYLKHIYGNCPHCKHEICCRLLDEYNVMK